MSSSTATTKPLVVARERLQEIEKRKKAPYGHLSPEGKKEALLLHSQRWSVANIARKLDVSPRTVWRFLKAKPQSVTVTALSQVGVPRKQLREEQKQILMEKFRASTEKVCDWIARLIEAEDPKGFALAMRGIEQLDKISGNSVGEGQPGMVTMNVQVDARAILAKITDYLGQRAALEK